MTFLYFAYGSNVLSTRLTARCPTARRVGIALARGHSLHFAKKSVDGSGKATLKPSSMEQATPGVVYEIDLNDRPALDRFESAGRNFASSGLGYHRIDDFHVELQGRTTVATTYLAAAPVPDLVPFDWYLALIVAGAVEQGFDPDYVARLRACDWMPDSDPTRQTRRLALQALTEIGHSDPLAVLQP